MLSSGDFSCFDVESGVFRDQSVFDIYTIPENYLFRDSQVQTISSNIRPALEGYSPIHTVLLGDFATGKTTAIKKIFQEVENHSAKVVCVYVNCKLCRNKYKVYSVIYKSVFSGKIPSRGVSTSRLYDEIMNKLRRDDKVLLIAFDDVDYLFKYKKYNELFYGLLRAYEMYKVKVGVFPILTGLDFKYKFNKDVSTVFIPQEVNFPQYNFTEFYKILEDRSSLGFKKGVINDEILERVSDIVAQKKNLRLGLNILKLLGVNAEKGGVDKITDENLNKVLKKITNKF